MSKSMALLTEQIVSLFFLLMIFSSCDDGEYREILLYENDFEQASDPLILSEPRFYFNGSSVLGKYNNSEIDFNLTVPDGFNFLLVELDLYIHDSWDGNRSGGSGPDIWGIRSEFINPGKNFTFFNFQTTFSNSLCSRSYCLEQSFPEAFPSIRDSKTGAIAILSESCGDTGTSYYRIEKLIPVSRKKVKITLYDVLKQSNTKDPKCDESWSFDNIMITSIKFEE